MNHNFKFSLETFLKLTNDLTMQHERRSLNIIKICLIAGFFDGRSHKNIADKMRHYIVICTCHLVKQLWQPFSKILGNESFNINRLVKDVESELSRKLLLSFPQAVSTANGNRDTELNLKTSNSPRFNFTA